MESTEGCWDFNFLTVMKTALPLTAAAEIIYQASHLCCALVLAVRPGSAEPAAEVSLHYTLHVALGLLWRAEGMSCGSEKGGSEMEHREALTCFLLPHSVASLCCLGIFFPVCVSQASRYKSLCSHLVPGKQGLYVIIRPPQPVFESALRDHPFPLTIRLHCFSLADGRMHQDHFPQRPLQQQTAVRSLGTQEEWVVQFSGGVPF